MACYSRKLSKGLRYFYQFDFQNRTYKSKAQYLSKFEARRAENDRYAEVSNLASNPSQKPIFALSDVMNDRLTVLKAKKGLKYYKTTKEYYKRLLDLLGNVEISTIKRQMIEDFLTAQSAEYKKDGLDNYSVNAMLRSFKALFFYAIDVKEIEMVNPCKKIQLFSVEKKIKYIPPTKDIEAVKLLCTPEQLLLLNFVDECGSRINEPLQMTGKDILADSIILYTRKSKNSNLVPRKLPLPDCLKGKTFKPEERVFPFWTEQPKFLMKKIRKLNQTPWGFHSLRHRRASLWSKQGVPIFDIMTRLGHSSLNTTLIYLQSIG